MESVDKGRQRRQLHTRPSALAEVEVTMRLSARGDLAYIQESRGLSPRYRSTIDPARSSQSIFISELLYRILTHPESDPDLYDFISESLTVLEYIERGVANFYLCFTYRLLHYLAIAPAVISQRGRTMGQWFDLQEARCVDFPKSIHHALPPEEVVHLQLFDRMTYANLGAFRYSRQQRGYIIDRLLQYYRLHLPPFPEIRCLEVLRQAAGPRGSS